MSSAPWRIVYTSQALKDKIIAYEAGFAGKIKNILEIVRNNPYAQYPPFEKLIGDLNGAYSRRINRQHRFVYQVYQEDHTVKVISMWTHYHYEYRRAGCIFDPCRQDGSLLKPGSLPKGLLP